MMVKTVVRQIHLWLGLLSGLLVFIIAITGAIYTFQEEIQDATKDYRFTAVQQIPVKLPSELLPIAEKELPGKKVHSIQYSTASRSVEALFYSAEKGNEYYYIVYLNPYSGEVLGVENVATSFFRIMLDGHMYLWLPRTIGAPVVLIATLVFLVMVISGIVLWWPKQRKNAKQRLSFQWRSSTSVKRKTWDLHAVIGFYASWVALIFIITGLVWGLPGFANGFHKAMGGEKSMLYHEPISVKDSSNAFQDPLDLLFIKEWERRHAFKSIELHPAETDSSSIVVVTNELAGTYWKSNYRYFNQYSLKELPVTHIWGEYKDATAADKVLRMNYDIHVGAIGGLAGKIAAFLFSLMIASLPVTGFLIWWRR